MQFSIGYRERLSFDKLLRFVIGLEDSRYILNQSDLKLKLQLWNSRFPARYWIRSLFFSVARCSIGRCDYLRFGSPTRNQNALKMNWSFSGLAWSDFFLLTFVLGSTYLALSVDQQTLRQTLRLFWPTTTKSKRSNQILKKTANNIV